jgi:hypothetical protein
MTFSLVAPRHPEGMQGLQTKLKKKTPLNLNPQTLTLDPNPNLYPKLNPKLNPIA